MSKQPGQTPTALPALRWLKRSRGATIGDLEDMEKRMTATLATQQEQINTIATQQAQDTVLIRGTLLPLAVQLVKDSQALKEQQASGQPLDLTALLTNSTALHQALVTLGSTEQATADTSAGTTTGGATTATGDPSSGATTGGAAGQTPPTGTETPPKTDTPPVEKLS